MRFTHLASILLVCASTIAPTARAFEPSASPPPPPAARVRDDYDCERFAARPNVVLAWNDAALTAISQTPTPPTVSSRALAMLNTAMYDAWAAYDDVALATTTFGLHRRPLEERTPANKREAMSVAAYVVLANLYSDLRYRDVCFFDLMYALGYDIDPDADNEANLSSDLSTPGGVGAWAGRMVVANRRGDGSNEDCDTRVGTCLYLDNSGYKPVNAPASVTGTLVITDPNRWQPLIVTDLDSTSGVCEPGPLRAQAFTTPHWGSVNSFALGSAPVTGTLGPILWSAEDPGPYELQARETISISAELDDEKKVIAAYWANGPDTVLPPGHWITFGQVVSERDGHTLDDDAKMFFALGNGVFDAGIMAWHMKRQYDSVRPLSAVHFALAGQTVRAWAGPGLGVQEIPAEQWMPYQKACFVTPPFGEYVSGHSAFSAAGAEVLRQFTGSDAFGASAVLDTNFIDSTYIEGEFLTRPVTLTWATFTEAADQSGLSRRYGGIHFERGDLDGRTVGRAAGERAYARAQQYISGTLPVDVVYVPMVWY
jgi:hypothetical protein